RSFAVREEKSRALQMSGKNSRLGSRDHAKAGLSAQVAQEINERERALFGARRELPQGVYFKSVIKRNPLLVIYPVSLKIKEDETPDNRKQEILHETAILPAIIGLS